LQTYLHTGDFRFNKEIFSQYAPLRPFFRSRSEGSSSDNSEAKELTAIYLDTTYCDPIYTFPKQTEAVKLITDIVKEKKRQGKRTLVLIGTYYIGKERIASNIAEECNCKIFVTIDKHKAIKCLNLKDEDRFTTNPSLTDVHIVPMMHLGWKKLFENRATIGDKYDEIVAFRPSAWCFKELAEESSAVKSESMTIQRAPVNFTRRSNITVVDVPYSEHSSFNELRDCVEVCN
jgi:DNA cross-link repair 1A protein